MTILQSISHDLRTPLTTIKDGEGIVGVASVDVVVGYVEPHDRPDTMHLLEGVETIPLKTMEYKGKVFHEFDVDEAIKRNPRLILVDELAHTNVVGSKNAKRYLDVIELLNHGIDVYTTVNVQHIEGLHDLIDTSIDVDVKERIPDEIFDYADEVVLIDIEPVDLIEGLDEEAVIEWCLKNGKPAGCGTDTLTNRHAIYFPIKKNNDERIVICFYCLESKMSVTDRLLFSQIEDFLGIII